MIDILTYSDLNTSSVKNKYKKVIDQLQKGDFSSADVKKMSNNGFYRAKLDSENRLLFQFGEYNNKTCIFILEVILNHEYDKSRFLRGHKVDESKLQSLNHINEIAENDKINLVYVNKNRSTFHFLDKVLSFDDDQNEIFSLPLPLIIIGSAGSGKTALTIEKLKTLKGRILYVTLSSFLAENSAELFYSNNYENEKIDIDFLSYQEFIETIKIPKGRAVDYKLFDRWARNHMQSLKIRDTHKVFEEFRGVITGMNIHKEFLSREDYMNLGVKQSVFLDHEKEKIYDLFEKYLKVLNDENIYDANIVSHQWLQKCSPEYDFIVVDEVQDLTNIQLYLILKSLRKPTHFLLCGDSNQVVHPTFFSWSNVKSMFYTNNIKADLFKILHTNFRNSHAVSEKANNLLKIKNARFGSLDRESNYLVNTISQHKGEISFLEQNNKDVFQLNKKTFKSSHYAVIVMRDEDKSEARKLFKTPLLFSVQEAKGLEYENIILFNLVSRNSKEFIQITEGVTNNHLEVDELNYSRGKNKADKDIEVFKFYINSLYVALTRAVKNVYVIEESKKHPILALLDIVEKKEKLNIKEEISSADEWKREARRLERQGKKEQSDAIRTNVLSIQEPTWDIITAERYNELQTEAFDSVNYNKKAKDKLFDFSLIHGQTFMIQKLADHKYRKAENFEKEGASVIRKHYQPYVTDKIKNLVPKLSTYGLDFRDQFNFTPLHAAAYTGARQIAHELIENGANPGLRDTFKKTPLQIALSQGFMTPGYAEKSLGDIYPLLVTDSLKIMVDGKLIKIDNHKIEYFLLNLLLVVQPIIMQKKTFNEVLAIKMDDILEKLSTFPDNVLPGFRKKRTYLSSILSKNEVDSNSPYNRKLFIRIERGNYILNRDIELFIDDKWIPIDHILKLQEIDSAEFLSAQKKKYDEEMAEMKKQAELAIQREERNSFDSFGNLNNPWF